MDWTSLVSSFDEGPHGHRGYSPSLGYNGETFIPNPTLQLRHNITPYETKLAFGYQLGQWNPGQVELDGEAKDAVEIVRPADDKKRALFNFDRYLEHIWGDRLTPYNVVITKFTQMVS